MAEDRNFKGLVTSDISRIKLKGLLGEGLSELRLNYLSLSLLITLLELDESVAAERKTGGKSWTDFREESEAEDILSSMQKKFTTAQLSEFFWLMIVGRGDILPEQMAERVEEYRAGFLPPDYVFSKIGNNYIRKAISRFGVLVIGTYDLADAHTP